MLNVTKYIIDLEDKNKDDEELPDNYIGNNLNEDIENQEYQNIKNTFYNKNKLHKNEQYFSGVRIIISNNDSIPNNLNGDNPIQDIRSLFTNQRMPRKKQDDDDDDNSGNFKIIKNSQFKFSDIGGYELIKEELLQCADLLTNHTKYSKYNVRTPKGLILEGPPGNGKTLFAKCFSGEIDVNFIPVSGAQFQEKYVGVGASRVRELFELAKKNIPCVIFIDEIDALGRKRSNDADNRSEQDNTLNELLVNLDGYENSNGIFVIGATNRADLLDSALTRPGRIDKKIYIGNPDRKTREQILNIHIKGKPYDDTIKIDHLIDITNGFSGAEIENLLNEAMLYVLRDNRECITLKDLDIITNRVLVGWQTIENKLTDEMLFQVAVHEMGHALVGILTKYKKLVKVTINLWSPKSLGFTLFETEENQSKLITKDKMISELMVLLGGRIAEEIFFENKISNGASQDLAQAKQLVESMVLDYGMGNDLIIPHHSNKYKETIDEEIDELIKFAYQETKFLLLNSKQLLEECGKLLASEHEITPETIEKKIRNKYPYIEL